MIEEKLIKKYPLNVVVTGGNSGIGYGTVKQLYEEGHNVIFGSRRHQKNQQAVKNITTKQGGSLKAFCLDLTQRRAIQQFAEHVKWQFPDRIDILINNSALALGEKQISELGIDMMMTANYFGHFYLTYLLFPLITKSNEGRIINVSSMGHKFAKDDILANMDLSQGFDMNTQYSNSKMANVQFTLALANRLEKQHLNVRTASLNPGFVRTQFFNKLEDQFYTKLVRCFQCCCPCVFVDPDEGAHTTLYLCQIPFHQIVNGAYYDNENVSKTDKRASDYKNQQVLWKKSEELYQIKFNV